MLYHSITSISRIIENRIISQQQRIIMLRQEEIFRGFCVDITGVVASILCIRQMYPSGYGRGQSRPKVQSYGNPCGGIPLFYS
ncbi:hypothetical protein SAY87_003128 [Trapa incisa]|uniref:Uncharacterized protein n=1 Tax=Trapa incisa TaxID=236973 RepID=A0AAN7QHC2_9MYRT|nr:hypothetical protein SAY87_003128 [Trapa incisa]